MERSVIQAFGDVECMIPTTDPLGILGLGYCGSLRTESRIPRCSMRATCFSDWFFKGFSCTKIGSRSFCLACGYAAQR
jgi:hypothetical protein